MKQDSLIDLLPPWIDPEAYLGFKEMRKKMKKPMTDRAEAMLMKKLSNYNAEGYDVNQILDQSTFNCWQDIFPPKGDNNGQQTNPKRRANDANSKVQDAIERREASQAPYLDGQFRRH